MVVNFLSKYEKVLYDEIFKYKEYGFLDNYIKSAKTIFDIWGHFWFFSLYCIEIIGWNDKLDIHYFEPVNKFYIKAKNLFKKQNWKIYLNNKWVWIQSVEMPTFINKDKTMQTTIYKESFLNKNWVEKMCKYIRLQDYMEDNVLCRIDLMKIDIEGAEFDVLLNLEKKYFDIISVLCFEYHLLDVSFERKFKKLLSILSKNYWYIEIKDSKYSDKIWYVLCYR